MNEKKVSSNIIKLAHGAGGVMSEELISFITKNITFKNVNKELVLKNSTTEQQFLWMIMKKKL